jgi:hypothetical protein
MQEYGIRTGLTDYFGNGDDGDSIIPGTTTLTRRMHYDNLDINIGGTLENGQNLIYVKTF